MNLNHLFKNTERFVSNNSPAILTAIGVVGTISAVVLTGKATFKAAELIRERDEDFHAHHEIFVPLTAKERAELLWKLYIPAAGVTALTIGCIIGSNRIGTRRAAAMAAAYSVSERALEAYKDKVVEKFGETKADQVRDEIAQDRIRDNPMGSQVLVTKDGDVPCFDSYTGRYFSSTMEAIKRAQNDLNYKMLSQDYATLSDFYDHLDLPHTKHSDNLGWAVSDGKVEVVVTTTVTEDVEPKPCFHVDFNRAPDPNFFRTR